MFELAHTDGDPVPVPHFGLVLTEPQFQSLAADVKAAGIDFVIQPHLRFEGIVKNRVIP